MPYLLTPPPDDEMSEKERQDVAAALDEAIRAGRSHVVPPGWRTDYMHEPARLAAMAPALISAPPTDWPWALLRAATALLMAAATAKILWGQ